MESIFGVPMNTIMAVMLVLLAVALSSVVWVALRQRIFFVMGLRNIPRRRAQTTLIIIGLMLSTLIISSALSTGDTVDHSITNIAYTTLGSIDELVGVSAVKGASMQHMDDSGFFAPGPVPASQYQKLATELQGDPNVDGLTPLIRQPVAVLNPRARLSKPLVFLCGLDPGTLGVFRDDIRLVGGGRADVGSLAADEMFVNKTLAEKVDAVPGDTLQVFVGGQPHTFRVAGVVENAYLAGASGGGQFNMGGLVRMDVAQSLFNRADYDYIAISNKGGVREGLSRSDAVVDRVAEIVSGAGLEARPFKREIVDQAETMGSIMTTMFVVLGLFSIGAGMLLIFLIFVMLAAERKSEMGMARAVGTKRMHLVETFMAEGMAYNVVSAAVGAALGLLVAWGMTAVMAWLMSQFNVAIAFHATVRSLVVAYAVGVVLTFLTVTFSSWRVSALNIVRAIRDIPDPQRRRTGRRSLYGGIALAVLGSLLTAAGIAGHNGFGFGLGVSGAVVGVAMVARFVAVPERPLFTALGGGLLVFWILAAGGKFDPLLGKLGGGIELYFLSGVIMVGSATFVMIHNADLLLSVLAAGGARFGRVLPALKTAIAYPLANKFRTGMTVAMISLVVFALVMQSVMNANFDKMFLSDDSRAGWDIVLEENPSNRLSSDEATLVGDGADTAGGLVAALRDSGRFDVSQIEAVGRVDQANRLRVEVRQGSEGDYASYPLRAVDRTFLDHSAIKLQIRARGYDSDQAVWDALRSDPEAAVVDSFALPSGGFGPPSGFTLSGVTASDREMDPIYVDVHDASSGRTRTVHLIGVIDLGSSANFYGIFTTPSVLKGVFGASEASRYYVKLVPGADAKAAAKAMESALLERGIQATSLKAEAEDQQQLSRAFFWLMEGFMGLGLFVGTAAVGVVAFRTVVERRQQIGMLRAIGYTRGTVMLSFILESSFVALLGVVSGVVLALALAFELVTGDLVAAGGLPQFFVPWGQVALIAGFAFGSSFLMTIIPSRQAASIPIAAALRYE